MGKHSAVVLTSNQNTEENNEAECLLNTCDMAEESNKLSVFVGDVFKEADIFTLYNKIEPSTITLNTDNESININTEHINLNANNKDIDLLNAFDLEVNHINIKYAMKCLKINFLITVIINLKKCKLIYISCMFLDFYR